MPLPRYARLLTLLLAAIQFAAPAAVSVADGAFAKLVRDPGMHVESSGDACTPPHAADCTVCRFLTTGQGDAPARVAELRVELTLGAPVVPVFEHGVSLSAATRSRAPPV